MILFNWKHHLYSTHIYLYTTYIHPTCEVDLTAFFLLNVISIITLNLDSPILSSGCYDTSLHPGTIVYMTAFINVNEIYIRKLEDYNDKYHDFLEKVNAFCLSGKKSIKMLITNVINCLIFYC